MGASWLSEDPGDVSSGSISSKGREVNVEHNVKQSISYIKSVG